MRKPDFSELIRIFHHRLDKLCNESGTSISAFLSSNGMDSSSASKWKNGNTEPKIGILYLASQKFGVSCDYLLGVENTLNNVADGSLNPDEIKIIDILQNADPAIRAAAFASLRVMIETFEARKNVEKSSVFPSESNLPNKGAV